jgi:hypothetical protein
VVVASLIVAIAAAVAAGYAGWFTRKQAKVAERSLEIATGSLTLALEQNRLDHPPALLATVEWEIPGDRHWLRITQLSGVAIKSLDVKLLAGPGEGREWFMPNTPGVHPAERDYDHDHASTYDESSGKPAGLRPGNYCQWEIDYDRGGDQPAEVDPLNLLVNCKGYDPLLQHWENLSLGGKRALDACEGTRFYRPPLGLPEQPGGPVAT